MTEANGAMPTLQVQPGVETLTVTGAPAGSRLLVERVGSAGTEALVTVVADDAGHAHVGFVPDTHGVMSTIEDWADALSGGQVIAPGDYTVAVVSEDGEPVGAVSGPHRVMAVSDLPDPSLYDQKVEEGFGYLEVRDGVTLSIMVRFPNQDMYGPGPWPTVIEYSGYGPSNPDAPQPGTLLAGLMGFATVGVNMRGTGCSGGVFDVFSPAQAADGYDVVETIARQPWVQHGHVGMVGLSYPGISQLYVAATRPPSLAAITPLSVIDDLWRQQWPGGTYNSGFTRAWLAMRDAEIQVGGQAWDQARIDAGDTQAAANQAIRSQNLDFERFGRAIENFRPTLEARRIESSVHQINVPVYLTGAWQDEQTGSRFGLMLEQFDASPHTVMTVFNGHHPDGYSPMVILRWFEFLSFHVARRVPVVPELVRTFAPLQFAEVFGVMHDLEDDRFGDLVDDFDAACDRYRSDPLVRILFESGAGSDTPGACSHRFEVGTESFPPPDLHATRWWFTPEGGLVDDAPELDEFVEYDDDPSAGEACYAIIETLQDFTKPTVPMDWTRFPPECLAQFETAPLVGQITIAGQGHVDLWLRPGTEDTSVQVSLTEIRPDGYEVRVQSGWHRPQHREEDPDRSDGLRVDYTFTPEDRSPLVVGELIRFRIPLMPVAHVFRSGSRLRVAVSTPGRDHPLWCFDSPVVAGATHQVGCGGSVASSLVLPVWVADQAPTPELAGDHPAVDSLRGQPFRTALPIANRLLDGGAGVGEFGESTAVDVAD